MIRRPFHHALLTVLTAAVAAVGMVGVAVPAHAADTTDSPYTVYVPGADIASTAPGHILLVSPNCGTGAKEDTLLKN